MVVHVGNYCTTLEYLNETMRHCDGILKHGDETRGHWSETDDLLMEEW